MSIELYLGPVQPTVNPKTKRFQKGHVPYNKGKKMKDIMGEEKYADFIKKATYNLKLAKRTPHPTKVVSVKDGKWKVYPSMKLASEKTGARVSCIVRCCCKKGKHAGGYQWFYERGNEWLKYI